MLSIATADRLEDCFDRWTQVATETHDACPICGQLVIITPKGEPGVASFAHRSPVCTEWSEAMALMGIVLEPQHRSVASG